MRTQEEWIAEYQVRNALCIHDGDQRRPHALLTGDNHSNGYFNSRRVTTDRELMRQAASDLINLYLRSAGNIELVDRVVGPHTGGAVLAKFLAAEIAFRLERPCKWSAAYKTEFHGKKFMAFRDPERIVAPGETVLLCDDVLTTGGSLQLTEEAIHKRRGHTLYHVCVIVNRSGLTHVNGKEITALVHHHMPVWTPGKCPLCKLGSQAIRPKGGNWMLLNASY